VAGANGILFACNSRAACQYSPATAKSLVRIEPLCPVNVLFVRVSEHLLLEIHQKSNPRRDVFHFPSPYLTG
jgi:hypothetical protein